MGEDTDMNETGAVDQGGELDPRTAAALLEQTKRRAQRQFEFPSPLLTLIQAGAVLAAYGAIWLSVRGQNPYSGPSYPALAALYAFVAVAAIAATWEGRRANAGVIRRSSRQQWSRAIPLVAAFLAVYVLMGALRSDGFSYAIGFGLLPAAGPLIVVGAAMAGYAAAREEWQLLGGARPSLAGGAGSAFAGPVGVWGVAGAGICAVLVCRAIVQVWLRRA